LTAKNGPPDKVKNALNRTAARTEIHITTQHT